MPRGGVFIYVGAYPDETAARADERTVRHLHSYSRDLVGRFETAVIVKDREGKIHAVSIERDVHSEARMGVVVGAVLGAMFPPAAIATATVGGLIGAGAGVAGGRGQKQIPAGDLDALGQLINPGEAAMIVVGDHHAGLAVENAPLEPTRHGKREVSGTYSELEDAVMADLKTEGKSDPGT